eukprot:5745772-Amphidinium_carterae.1
MEGHHICVISLGLTCGIRTDNHDYLNAHAKHPTAKREYAISLHGHALDVATWGIPRKCRRSAPQRHTHTHTSRKSLAPNFDKA